jgi:hypothetical protein
MIVQSGLLVWVVPSWRKLEAACQWSVQLASLSIVLLNSNSKGGASLSVLVDIWLDVYICSVIDELVIEILFGCVSLFASR